MPSGASIAKLRPKALPPIGSRIRSTPRPSGNLSYPGDYIFAAVVDCVLGTESLDCAPFCLRVGNPDHIHTGDQRELHRCAADPARCSVDEHPFRRDPASCRVQQVISDLAIRQA